MIGFVEPPYYLTDLTTYLLTLGYMCPFASLPRNRILSPSNATRCVPTLVAGQDTEGSRCCFAVYFGAAAWGKRGELSVLLRA